MSFRLALGALLLTSLAVGASPGATDAETATDGGDLRLRLVLRQALPQGNEQVPGAPSVIISLHRTDGVWQRVWATSGNYNRKEHSGRVDVAETGDGGLQLELILNVKGDPWVPGGRLHVTVDLEDPADNKMVGTYEGVFRGIDIKGKAEATVLSEPTQYALPAEPGEHPRLLFRAEDLPALKAKAKTTFGKLALAKMNNSAAGSAFRYALTGDASLAADARKRVEAMMPDREDGSKRVRSRWWAWRIEQAAIAYDLCYDAWDEDFRREVADYLQEAANIILYNRGVLDNHISWDYGGSHAPTMLWGAGVAGLAIAGEKGPEPNRPEPPHLISPAKGLVEPAEGYKPGKDVPVVGFTDDRMPRKWLYAGPFPEDHEPLATDEQRSSARPKPGQKLGVGKHRTDWRKLKEGKGLYKGRYSGGQTILELTGPHGVVTHTQSYYYTVLQNDKPRWVRVHAGHGGVEVYLGGVALREGDVVRLQPGLYPWLATGPIGEMNPWGKSFAEPKLIELDAGQVDEARARATTDYEHRLADWRQDHDQWERTGGADIGYLKTAECARHVMDIVFAETLGRGGFLSGDGMMQAMSGPHKYAYMYRRATGRNPGAHAEIADYLPRSMFVHPYRPDHKVIGQEINGAPGFACSGYPESGRDSATELFAALLPLVRKEWQPVALWAWQYHTGGSTEGEGAIEKLLKTQRSGYAFGRSYGSFETHPIYTFLNYPLDIEPEHPKGDMPLTWQAPDFGFYGFRNEWTGKDNQFIVQFFSATYGEGAGTLRVAGLGQVWSHGMGKPTQRRYGENVVQLLDDEINVGARGRVTHLATRDDGSGCLSVDLSDVYSAPVIGPKGKPLALYDRYGHVPHPNAFGDSGITGMRSMAVDYSGKSGARCLVAIVDRIKGGGTKSWTWQIESSSESAGSSKDHPKKKGWIVYRGREFKSPSNGELLFRESKEVTGDDSVALANDGFTLTRGDATMRATFITPTRPEMEFARKAEYRDMPKHGVRKDSSKAIFATGGDAFFVILTFQEGEPPKVETVRGEGLDAVVRVGKQTVRFDGEKIVFGD